MADTRIPDVPADALGADRVAEAIETSPRDRVLRAYAALPVAPVWVGLGLAGGYVALYLGFNGLFGPLHRPDPMDPWAALDLPIVGWEIVTAIVMAYVLTAHVYTHRGAQSDLRMLRTVLACTDRQFAELIRETACVPLLRLHVTGAVGVLGGLLIVLFDPGIWGGDARPELTDPVFVWSAFHNALMGWCIARAMTTDIHLSGAFSRIGASLARVDLLDLDPLAPFARKGQRSVVVWTVFSMLFSLFFLGGFSARANPAMLIALVGCASALFVAPLLGVHRRIAAVKREEIERVNHALLRERERLLGSEDTPVSTRVAELAAWRALVEGVRAWPVSTGGLVRFAAFLVLGIGSWLGGAVAERLLGLALD